MCRNAKVVLDTEITFVVHRVQGKVIDNGSLVFNNKLLAQNLEIASTLKYAWAIGIPKSYYKKKLLKEQ